MDFPENVGMRIYNEVRLFDDDWNRNKHNQLQEGQPDSHPHQILNPNDDEDELLILRA